MKKCVLRALEVEDIDFLYLLENQEVIWEVSQTQLPFSKYILLEYIQNAKQDIYQAKQFRYVIHSLEENRAVGCIDLYDFDPKNKRACVGIALLEPFQRQGYGTNSLEILIDYAKNLFDLHQLVVYVSVENLESLRFFEKMGFISHGIKKDWIFSKGKYIDVKIYQLKL